MGDPLSPHPPPPNIGCEHIEGEGRDWRGPTPTTLPKGAESYTPNGTYEVGGREKDRPFGGYSFQLPWSRLEGQESPISPSPN